MKSVFAITIATILGIGCLALADTNPPPQPPDLVINSPAPGYRIYKETKCQRAGRQSYRAVTHALDVVDDALKALGRKGFDESDPAVLNRLNLEETQKRLQIAQKFITDQMNTKECQTPR